MKVSCWWPRCRTRTLAQLPFPAESVVGVLEHVEKPGNLGAIVRTADAAGVSAVIVADGGTDLYNPNAIRASLGAIFHVPVAAAGARDTRDWLESHSVHDLCGARRRTRALHAGGLSWPCAIVLGSEAQGLSDVWQGAGIQSIALPHARDRRQPERLGDGRRAVLRSAAATHVVAVRPTRVRRCRVQSRFPAKVLAGRRLNLSHFRQVLMPPARREYSGRNTLDEAADFG